MRLIFNFYDTDDDSDKTEGCVTAMILSFLRRPDSISRRIPSGTGCNRHPGYSCSSTCRFTKPQQLPGVPACDGGNFFSPRHPGNFVHPLLGAQRPDGRAGPFPAGPPWK